MKDIHNNGLIHIRAPKRIIEQLRAEAKANNRSNSEYIRDILENRDARPKREMMNALKWLKLIPGESTLTTKIKEDLILDELLDIIFSNKSESIYKIREILNIELNNTKMKFLIKLADNHILLRRFCGLEGSVSEFEEKYVEFERINRK